LWYTLAHSLREVFIGLRYVVRTAVQWRYPTICPHGIDLIVVKLPEAKKGFVLLP
jgi:hypothetical protein